MRYIGYVAACVLITFGLGAVQAETVQVPRVATHMGEPLSGPQGINQRLAQVRIRVPDGYQRAWMDGRLNALRGAGTARGQRAMEEVWTNTVPRRLVRK